MSESKVPDQTSEGPQSNLERKYIQEFLLSKGFNLESIGELPEEEQHQLMAEASRYASLKLAEVESRAKFRKDIHTPS